MIRLLMAINNLLLFFLSFFSSNCCVLLSILWSTSKCVPFNRRTLCQNAIISIFKQKKRFQRWLCTITDWTPKESKKKHATGLIKKKKRNSETYGKNENKKASENNECYLNHWCSPFLQFAIILCLLGFFDQIEKYKSNTFLNNSITSYTYVIVMHFSIEYIVWQSVVKYVASKCRGIGNSWLATKAHVAFVRLCWRRRRRTGGEETQNEGYGCC